MKKILSLLAILVMAVTSAFADDPDYLCFTAEEAGAKVSFNITGSLTTPPSLQYQTVISNASDQWKDYTFGEEITLTNIDDKVYFKAGTTDGTVTSNSSFSKDYYNYITFISTGKVAASGNIMSLLDATCESTTIPAEYTFCYLFYGCTSLTAAPELPATELADRCYYHMFNSCTSLTEAPELPATELADMCYNSMFRGCTSLTAAPELPATTLAENCYVNMFEDCTSLTAAPALPATSLAEYCYAYMFDGCTSLTEAPELKATTLAKKCYMTMFFGCTGLTEAPELPATSLAEYCYYGMFYGCTGLTAAPELPATSLAEYCYANMFQGCSKLNKVTVNFTDWNPSDATTDWLSGVAPEGTFTCPAGLDVTTKDASHVPADWTVSQPTVTQLTAPTLAVVNPTTIETLKTITVTNPNENGTLMYQWDAQEDGEWSEVPEDGNVTTADMEAGEHTLYAYVATTDEQTYSNSDVASVTVTTYTPATVAKVALEAVMAEAQKYCKGGEAEFVVPTAAIMINKAYEYAESVDKDAEATEVEIVNATEVLTLATKVAPVIELAFAQETEYGYYRLLGEQISVAYLQYLVIKHSGVIGSKAIAAALLTKIKSSVEVMIKMPQIPATAKANTLVCIATSESLGNAMSEADEAFCKLLDKDPVLSNTEEVVVKAHNYVLTHEEEALKEQVLAQMNVVLQAVIDWLDKTMSNMMSTPTVTEEEVQESEASVIAETANLEALLNDGVVTAINTANADNDAAKTVKAIVNGKLVIKSGNTEYNAAGALVK